MRLRRLAHLIDSGEMGDMPSRVAGALAAGMIGLLAALAAAAGSAMADDLEDAVRLALRSRVDEAAIEEPTGDAPIRASGIYGVVDGTGPAFLVAGRTSLPARSRLHLILEFEEKQVDARRATVGDGGRFECVLGPYPGRRVFQGVYAVAIEYQPHLQPASGEQGSVVPLPYVSAAVEIRVGDAAGAESEREERRLAYVVMVERLDALASEMDREAIRAANREAYVLGAEREFDEVAWRRWASGWRKRLEEGLGDELKRYRDEEVLALRIPDAHGALATLVALYLNLMSVSSREVYEIHGRSPAPEDRPAEGGALLNRSAILRQIEKVRGQLARLLGLEGEAPGDGGECPKEPEENR